VDGWSVDRLLQSRCARGEDVSDPAAANRDVKGAVLVVPGGHVDQLDAVRVRCVVGETPLLRAVRQVASRAPLHRDDEAVGGGPADVGDRSAVGQTCITDDEVATDVRVLVLDDVEEVLHECFGRTHMSCSCSLRGKGTVLTTHQVSLFGNSQAILYYSIFL